MEGVHFDHMYPSHHLFALFSISRTRPDFGCLLTSAFFLGDLAMKMICIQAQDIRYHGIAQLGIYDPMDLD